jgi:hypothetical protein
VRFRLLFAAEFAAAMLFAGWLMFADSSPLKEYFLYHEELPNVFRFLHVVPVIIAALAAGNPHSLSEPLVYGGVIIQWFVVGFLLSKRVEKLLR